MHGDKFDIKHSTTLKSIMILSKDRHYFLVVLCTEAPAQWSNIYVTERWWHSKSYFITNKLKIDQIDGVGPGLKAHHTAGSGETSLLQTLTPKELLDHLVMLEINAYMQGSFDMHKCRNHKNRSANIWVVQFQMCKWSLTSVFMVVSLKWPNLIPYNIIITCLKYSSYEENLLRKFILCILVHECV